MLLDILAHYPWAMGVLLGDIHLSALEILDKPSARTRIELATSVDNSDHLVYSSPIFLVFSTLPEFIIFALLH